LDLHVSRITCIPIDAAWRMSVITSSRRSSE